MNSSGREVKDLSDRILAVIDDVAREALASNRATRRQGCVGDFPTIELDPRNQLAAPLEVTIETEHLVTCFPGRHDMAIEMFSKDPTEMAQNVRGLVQALIEGRYSEKVNDVGDKVKIAAEWSEGSIRFNPHYNVVFVPKPGSRLWRNWRQVTYEPY